MKNFKSIFHISISLILHNLKLFWSVSAFSNLKSQKHIITPSKMILGHFKLKIWQKCVSFEPKLGFLKFKSPNRSEFHQKSEFRSIFGAICSKSPNSERKSDFRSYWDVCKKAKMYEDILNKEKEEFEKMLEIENVKNEEQALIS